MADLFTAGLAAVGIGGSIAGASENAESAQLTGQASSSMYLYQSAIAQQNAKIARQNAAWTRIAGEQQAATVGSQARATIGQTRAAQGASGLQINSGSNADVVASEHQIGSLEQTATRSSAAQAAYGYDVQAAQDRSQSAIYKQASTYALEGADIGSTASMIGGATSVASKWLQASQSGAFSSVGSYVSNAYSSMFS